MRHLGAKGQVKMKVIESNKFNKNSLKKVSSSKDLTFAKTYNYQTANWIERLIDKEVTIH